MSQDEVQTVMQKIQEAFIPEKAAGVDANIQFHLTGDQGGDYYATIKDQKLNMDRGTIPNPNLMLSANTQDLMNIYQGKLNPMQAFMQGKIQFKGDMSLAMKLMDLFKRP